MPNFLNNSIDQLNRGYQQMYGRPVAAPVAQAQPSMVQQPAAPIAQPPTQPQPLDPYDEAHRLYQQAIASDGQPHNEAARNAYLSHLNRHFPGHIERTRPTPVPTPISQNPEVGQPVGANSGDGSTDTGGLLSWLQNFFGNLTGGANQGTTSTGQTAPLNVPLLNPDTQVGPATPTTPQAPQTTGGVATDSPGIDASNAANTSFGGGGMSGGQMGSSAIGAIGSGLSNIGKNIANTKSSYTAPNLPLPQKANFLPPNLAPNTKVSY
jgi:hypothetical protein